jgi:arginyl-tRNA synthetase
MDCHVFTCCAVLCHSDTALALEYAHVRLQSIIRRAGESGITMESLRRTNPELMITSTSPYSHASERDLALHIIAFHDVCTFHFNSYTLITNCHAR